MTARRVQLCFGSIAAAFVFGSLVVPSDRWSAILQAALLALTSAATVVGPKLYPPPTRRGLVALTAAMLVATASRLAEFVAPPAPGAAAPGLWVGLLPMVAFGLVVTSVFRITSSRVRGGRRELAIDTTLVVVAVAAVLHGLVAVPGTAGGPDGFAPAALSVLPLLQAPVVAASFRLLATGGHRLPAAWLLTGSATAVLAAMIVGMLAGTPQLPTSAELLMAASACFIIAGTLHPSYARIGEPAPPSRTALPFGRIAVIGFALLALPATMLRNQAGSVSDLPAMAAFACVALVVLRMVLMVRELGRHSRYEQALADLGRAAVDAEGVPAFKERARALVEHATGGRWSLADDGAVQPLRDPREPRLELATFLQTASDLAQAGLRRWQAEAELTRRALYDDLTGLPNRSLAMSRLEAEIAHADRADGSIAVMFVDLDGFKQINDRRGHAVGDEVLTAVADRLANGVRPGDTVARLSGDEFLVIAPATTAAAAEALTERLHAALREPLAVSVGTVHVSASVGTSVLAGEKQTAEDMLREADMQMYAAKYRARAAKPQAMPAR